MAPEARTTVNASRRGRAVLVQLFCDFAFIVLGVLYLPIFAYRAVCDRDWRRAIAGRLGFPPRSKPGESVVWIHGVSVGEVKGLSSLVDRVSALRPDLSIVVSTTTSTGQRLARERYRDHRVIHYPLDFGPCPGFAIRRIRPRCIVLMELEIWPRFVHAAVKRGIPVIVVSARISERSFRGYRRARFALPQFDWISQYCVQNEVYRKRLIELGVAESRLTVTGNLKYDNAATPQHTAQADELRAWLAADGRPVLVCGSTHRNEDEMLADAGRAAAKANDCRVRIVIAPRHPDRVPAVLDVLQQRGHQPLRWSDCEQARPALGDEVLVVDTIGQLEAFYGACDVAFVGGSLVPHGGQNMIEPAALGRAVVFGPHTENFRSEVELLLAAKAALRVEDEEGAREAFRTLFRDEARRQELGDRAAQLVEQNQGAVERTVEILGPYLPSQV